MTEFGPARVRAILVCRESSCGQKFFVCLFYIHVRQKNDNCNAEDDRGPEVQNM